MTEKTNRTIEKEIIGVCKRLYNRNLLAAADGNVSYRENDQSIYITPSGVSKAQLLEGQLSLINIEGETLKGRPSSEKLMHLQIYKSCPEAKAVVHAHPPTAIAWSVARPELEKLPNDSLSELILAVGDIPFVPYARPGSQAMGDVLKPFLPHHRALILRRHGAICWGESLEEALMGMERIEHVSQILKSAIELGGLSQLPAEEVDALYEMRQSIGPKIL